MLSHGTAVTLAETGLPGRSRCAQKATRCKGHRTYPPQTEARLRIQGVTDYFHGKKKSMAEAGVPQYSLVGFVIFLINASCKTHHPQASSLYSSITAASKVRFPPSARCFPQLCRFRCSEQRRGFGSSSPGPEMQQDVGSPALSNLKI